MFNPDLLYGGITLALSFKAVLLVLIGTVLGVIIGAIPGLGPLMGIIPVSYTHLRAHET